MSKIVNKILFAILLLMSTLAFSQSVKEQYNKAIQRDNIQKKNSTERFEQNYRNAKVYLCDGRFSPGVFNNALIIIGSRIIREGSYYPQGQGDKEGFKLTINDFDQNSSVYKKSGSELSWYSSIERFTFDTQELSLYVNDSTNNLFKFNCELYKDTDKSTNQSAVPVSKPPPANQNQPTINRPTELEKALFSPMKL